MEKICLDFETALDFLRGEPKTIGKLKWYADREDVCVTAFTMAHLLEAVKKPEVTNAFVNSVTVLPFDKKAVSILNRLFA
jgi:predicted nucleic acid-binding protein